MGKPIEGKLKPSELKELQLVSAMIANGESTETIELVWEKALKKIDFKEKDINELIQLVLGQAYTENCRDLQYYAEKVRFFNEQKKQVRDAIKELRNYIAEQEERFASIEDDSQMTTLRLQNLLQKQEETKQTFSNVAKLLHDTATVVIRKIGG